MRVGIAYLLFLLIGSSCIAQGVDTTFIMAFGGENREEAVDIIEIDSAHVLVIGNTGSFGAGGSDVYFAKVSSAAELDTSWTWGGVTQDHAIQSMRIDASIFTLGYRNSFDDNTYRYFLLKMNLNGAVTGLIELGEFGSTVSYTMGQLDGTLILVESDESNLSVSRVDLDMEQHLIDEWNFPFSIDALHLSSYDSKLYVSSIQGSLGDQRLTLARLDSLSTWDTLVVRSTSFYAISDPVSIVNDSGDVFALFNFQEHPDSVWNINIYGYTNDLVLKWAREYRKPKDDFVNDAMINNNGEVSFIGFINSFGESGDFSFARYDTSGVFVDLRTLGGSDLDQGVSFIHNANDGYWLLGETNGFGTQMGDLLLYYTNTLGVTSSNAFIRVEDQLYSATGMAAKETELNMLPYPNPVEYGATINIPILHTDVEALAVYNMLGDLVAVFNSESADENLAISSQEIGVGLFYFEFIQGSGAKSYAQQILIVK